MKSIWSRIFGGASNGEAPPSFESEVLVTLADIARRNKTELTKMIEEFKVEQDTSFAAADKTKTSKIMKSDMKHWSIEMGELVYETKGSSAVEAVTNFMLEWFSVNNSLWINNFEMPVRDEFKIYERSPASDFNFSSLTKKRHEITLRYDQKQSRFEIVPYASTTEWVGDQEGPRHVLPFYGMRGVHALVVNFRGAVRIFPISPGLAGQARLDLENAAISDVLREFRIVKNSVPVGLSYVIDGSEPQSNSTVYGSVNASGVFVRDGNG